MGPKKKQKPKKKKDSLFMTDEEKEEEEAARKKAKQEMLERERLLKEMEKELRLAKLAKIKQDKVAMKEDNLRNAVVQKHCSEFKTFHDEYLDYLTAKRREKEWQSYIRCDHRPFANDPPALNTFLYKWKLMENILNINNIWEEIEIMFETILPVEEYINLPLDLKESTVNNLIEAKLNYYEEINNLVDRTTFDTVMDISKDHERFPSGDIEILRSSKNYSFWLWGWALSNRCHKQDGRIRPARKTPMVEVTLPLNMALNRYHLRIFYTTYDAYSLQTASYRTPPYPNNRNLYEEILNIRKLQVNALKTNYSSEYDECIMPWWFVLDEEILAEKRRREEKKKTKKKNFFETDNPDIEAESQNEEISEQIELTTTADNYVADEDEENDNRPFLFVPKGTQILYSRSMTELLEAKNKECLSEESDTSDQSSEASIVIPEIMKDITNCLNQEEKSELSFTARSEFLDRNPYRDISADRESALESLEELLFGDSDKVIENGKVTYVRRNPELRSIKELMKDIVPQKSIANSNMEPGVRKNVKEVLIIPQPSKPWPKITNVLEMNEMEMEISKVLDSAWEEFSNDCISKLCVTVEPSEINMRQYVILGGVYHFDFLEAEPQPFVNKDNFKVQIHYGEYKLKKVVFDRIPQMKVDLELETERKLSLAKVKKSMFRKTSKFKYSLTEAADYDPEYSGADDDLVWFALKLPQNILFFECPSLVRWDHTDKCWKTDDTYDTKWNSETNVLKFKLGKTGPFAVAAFRFSNLPYSDFHLKPSQDWKKNPTVALELKTQFFLITFVVKEDKITITELEHEKKSSISHITDVPLNISDMIVVMRNAGLDIFPDWDSFLYVHTTFRRLKSLEEHMYYSIGLSCPAYEFTRSPFNVMASDDKIYFQMRECVNKNRSEQNYRTLLAEPHKVSTVTTEGRSVKEDAHNLGAGFAPDLKYLVEATASKKALHRMKKASKCTIATVINLIKSIKILSYT